MAFTAIDTSRTKDYISPNDPDPKNPTVWKLGVLDVFQWAEVREVIPQDQLDSMKPEEEKGASGEMILSTLSIVKHGLRNLENFTGAQFQTETITRRGITYEVVTDGFLRKIPANILTELAGAILEFNTLSEDQAKN